jgi:mono/diheme cytochrome c family protein
MFRLLRRLVVTVLALLGLCAVAAAAAFVAGGISARAEPGRLEAAIAPRLRAMAIPRAARERKNPVPATPEAIADGMEHFADHCAVCHANDGSGDTAMGRGLYPRVPDMRLPATQDLSDGELFYIIENGVRLTGMPAWGNGTQEGEEASWTLVAFIRRQPELTEAELRKMSELNPRSAAEWQAEEEARRFLEGEPAEKPPRPRPHKHGR